jgi:hypothetical protein
MKKNAFPDFILKAGLKRCAYDKKGTNHIREIGCGEIVKIFNSI